MLWKKISMFAALAALSGCAALSSVLPTVMNVISTVQDATLIVEQIVDWVDAHFSVSPDPKREAEIKLAIQDVRATLVAANKAAQAGSDEEAALEAFRLAYGKLVSLLGTLPGAKLERREMFGPEGQIDDGFEIVSEKTGLVLSVPSPFRGGQ